MFGRHTDYHGTRRYTVEKPRNGDTDQLTLRVSLALAWIKLQLEKFLLAGAPTSTTTWLLRGTERHFTLLGAPERPRSKVAIADIFPIEGEARAKAKERRTPR
mgnify:CR=1 FL=1